MEPAVLMHYPSAATEVRATAEKKVCRITAVEVGSLSSYRKTIDKILSATKLDVRKNKIVWL